VNIQSISQFIFGETGNPQHLEHNFLRRHPNCGRRLLLADIAKGDITSIKIMLENGIQSEGLPLAVKTKNYEIVRLLIEHGANLFEEDDEGHWCFHYLDSNHDWKELLWPILLENIKLDPALKDQLAPTVYAALIPLLAALDLSSLEIYLPHASYYPLIITGLVVLISAIKTPQIVWQCMKDHDRRGAILAVIPWLAKAISKEQHFTKAILFAIPGILSMSGFIAKDLPKSWNYVRKNHAISGLLYFGACALRTSVTAMPAMNQLSKAFKNRSVNNGQPQPKCPLKPQDSMIKNCSLSILLPNIHASINLQCSGADSQIAVGLNPSKSYLGGKIGSIGLMLPLPAWYSLLSWILLAFPSQAKLMDERSFWAALPQNTIDKMPKVTLNVTEQQAQIVREYISDIRNDCDSLLAWKCRYQLIGRNCVDFAQEIFQLIDKSEHFVKKLDKPAEGMAGLYANLCSLFRINALNS